MDKNEACGEPSLSVITVCLNSEQTIRETLLSVQSQTWPGIEHIIIDGQSTDNTLSIVKEFLPGLGPIVSEKDSGIYHAMNKGLGLATGDYVFFLNSDDSFCDPDVVADVMSEISLSPVIDLVFGNVIKITTKGEELQKFEWVTPRNLIYGHLCHQAVFAANRLFRRHGGFNTQYRVSADFDWLLKVFLSSAKTRYIDRNIARFWGEGEHTRNREQVSQERIAVKLQHRSYLRYKTGELFFRLMRKIRRILAPVSS